MLIPVDFNIGKVPKLPNGKISLTGGTDIYIFDGKKHRQGGPAEINSRTGYQAWFRHGNLHRDNGPALIDPNNNKKEFWTNGKFIRSEALELFK